MMNLLPWRERRQQQWRQWMIIRCVLYVMFIIFIIAISRHYLFNVSKNIAVQNKALQQRINVIDIQHVKSNLLLSQHLKAEVIAKHDANKQNNEIATLLSDIANDIPDAITLTSLSIKQQKLTLIGVSPQLSIIHQFNAALTQQCIWKKIKLTRIENGQHKASVMHFTLWMAP